MPKHSTIGPSPLASATFCALLAALAAIAGCAAAGVAASPERVLARLDAMSEAQIRRPVEAARQAPTPPGVDEASFAEADDPDRAAMPLDEAVNELLVSAPIERPVQSVEAPVEAMRRYIEGRERRLEGAYEDAIAALEGAARLDPGAAAPWRELGEVYLARGDRLAASAAFRRALDRDPRDLRSLVQVALNLRDRRDTGTAPALLARAWRELDGDFDPALQHVVALALGRALSDLGYLRAASEALTIAVELPPGPVQPSIYIRELSEVYRDRGDIWRTIGDLTLRSGDPTRALHAYAQSVEYPSFDPGSLLPRRVLAAMRMGAPALAAEAVLLEIQRDEGQVESRHVRLIRYLAETTSLGPTLAAGIAAIRETLPERERALASSRLVRAEAAALDDGAAIRILRARLREAPADEAALLDLLGRIGVHDTRGLLRQATMLIEDAPLFAELYTRVLLRLRPDADRLLAEVESVGGSSVAKDLLRARLELALGDADAAESVLSVALERSGGAHPALIVDLSDVYVATGRYQRASELLDRLTEPLSRDLRLAKTIVLASMGRPEEALATLDPLLDLSAEQPVRVVEAVRAAQLHTTLGQYEEAEHWWRVVLELDPTVEDAYGGLLMLYQPSGPLPNRELLADTIGRLREVIPSSRTLRWIRARELLAERQFAAAARELVSLAEEEPSPAVVDALITAWLQTGETERAEQWLRERRRERPTDRVPVMGLSRVLASTDRAEQAATLLQDWLERFPADQAVSRQLETILRSALGRTEEADALAIRRLGESPQSLTAAIELAEILIRKERFAEAGAALEGALDSPVSLDEERLTALHRGLFQLAERAKVSPSLRPLTLRVFDLYESRPEQTPLALHNVRLEIMAMSETPAEEVLAALRRAVAQHARFETDLYIQTAVLLGRAQRNEASLEVISEAGRRAGQTDARVFELWTQLAVTQLDVIEAEAAIDGAFDAGVIRGLASRLLNSAPPRPEDAAASLAFSVGALFSGQGREDAGERLFRLALEYNPRHPMANNNLGYRMVERGERLAEAEAMLEIAYEEQSDSVAIIDSLGWVRYKLGMLRDELNEQGEVIEPGAVTLLERAAEFEAGRVDPVIHDHLGDAYWRVGREDEALERWIHARDRVEAQLLTQAERDASLEAHLERLRAKVQAARNDQEPRIAPLGERPDHEQSGDSARN